ncbi:hypothetical protein EGYY_16460 [Eggerthella sp. YY7918]|nr:hypothetical protein EGYY_16460 [Eggerthella sp. YY7918]
MPDDYDYSYDADDSYLYSGTDVYINQARECKSAGLIVITSLNRA